MSNATQSSLYHEWNLHWKFHLPVHLLLLLHIHFGATIIVVEVPSPGTFINVLAVGRLTDDLCTNEILHVGLVPFIIQVVMPSAGTFVHGLSILRLPDRFVSLGPG